MRGIIKTLKNVFIGWLLSFLIFVAYSLLIGAPISWIKSLDESYIQKIVLYPVIVLPFLGVFILIYTGIRFSSYKKDSFINLLFHHLVFILLYSQIIWFFREKKFETSMFDYFNNLFSITMYLAFHIILMKFFTRKFKL